MKASHLLTRLRFELVRLFKTVLLVFILLQLFFLCKILLMRWVDPESTSFERSEMARLALKSNVLYWSEHWVAYDKISIHLKRAVIVSEDDLFATHDGIQWAAVEHAWQKNQTQHELAEKSPGNRPLHIVGGSTITQQLAKNLFLSGERNFVRKGQELLITLALESLLSKKRILEIYLNHVEWGEGVFGAQAASQHYFHKPASQLTPSEAARLAVMLPRPKYFEKLPNSVYVQNRAEQITARESQAVLP
jgi:monofunctional biosynthetic peptidoglycan transglycosylase